MNFLVDPVNITNYNLNEEELELRVLWWVSAAGKNAKTSAKCLDKLLNELYEICPDKSPFQLLRNYDLNKLPDALKRNGIGCHTNKAKTFGQLAISDLDLKTCSVDDLDDIYGIGMKTSRCFVLHSRPDVRYSGLDKHMLQYLKDLGYDVPKSTPNPKKYLELEKIVLGYTTVANKSR